MSVIGYAYEADVHCEACTIKRFKTRDLDPDISIKDNESNNIHPMFSWEDYRDMYENENGEEEYCEPTCSDCMSVLQ